MSYTQSLDLCYANRIGPRGLVGLEQTAYWPKITEAVQTLRAAYSTKSLALLNVPERHDDLSAVLRLAARLKDSSDVVICGTGGSSLGGQALCQIAGWGVPGLRDFLGAPRLHFLDNLDPRSFGALFERLPLSTATFVIISKSGGTAETLMQALAVLDLLCAAGREAHIASQVFGLTEPANWKTNPLRQLLGAYTITMLEHDTAIGGRFSALTNVGLLPAAVMGLDLAAIRAGAAAVMASLCHETDVAAIAPAAGACASLALAEAGCVETVFMTYADTLERFGAWYAQLWAESLGKQGRGTTPLRALGPVDQHSQLQLYLDGPANKFFTLVTTDQRGIGPRMNATIATKAGLEEFAGKTVGDLVHAQGQATAETLAKRGAPVRRLHVPRLDETSIGALMMHFFLETVIAAHCLGVDPYDQPAVEEGKILAKAYLRAGGA